MAYYEYAVTHDGKGCHIWFEYDPDLVQAIKQVPSNFRKWDGGDKVWYVDIDWFKDACRFLDSAVNNDLGTKGHHGRERTQKDQQQKRRDPSQEWDDWKRNPFKGTGAKTKTCWEQLHLTEDAPLDLVKAAYRILSKIHHPDVGGDHKRMVEVNLAYKQAITIKQQEQDRESEHGTAGATV